MSSAVIILAKESICQGKIEYLREKKYILICRSNLGTSVMLQILQSCKLHHEVAIKRSWKHQPTQLYPKFSYFYGS